MTDLAHNAERLLATEAQRSLFSPPLKKRQQTLEVTDQAHNAERGAELVMEAWAAVSRNGRGFNASWTRGVDQARPRAGGGGQKPVKPFAPA